MTAGTAVRVDDLTNPFALGSNTRGNTVALLAGPREITRRRHPHHRKPELRRVVLRCGFLIGRRHRLEGDELSWCRFRLRGVAEAIPANPPVVLRRRQVRDEKASAIVSDDALDQACRK